MISGEKSLKKIREFFRVSIQRSCHSLMCSGANWLSFKFCRLSASVVRNFPWSLHFFTFVFPEEPFVFTIFNLFLPQRLCNHYLLKERNQTFKILVLLVLTLFSQFPCTLNNDHIANPKIYFAFTYGQWLLKLL